MKSRSHALVSVVAFAGAALLAPMSVNSPRNCIEGGVSLSPDGLVTMAGTYRDENGFAAGSVKLSYRAHPGQKVEMPSPDAFCPR